MISTSTTPRHNQIDLLTRGLELPFDALREEHLSAVADVLVIAWTDLLRSDPTTLLSGSDNCSTSIRFGSIWSVASRAERRP